MTDKDYIDHAINSIIFLHKYDESYKITKAAREKEEELFQGSIQFLKNLSVGKNESHIKTFTQKVISDKNEQISILERKIESLESLVSILKHCNNCKHHHVSGCDYEDKKECNWQTKTKWELCE